MHPGEGDTPVADGRFEPLTVGAESVRVYRTGAASGGAPAVAAFHAWWGLVDDVLDHADRLARAGFHVAAPDLVRGRTAATVEQADRLSSEVDQPHADAVTLAAIDHLVASGAPAVGTLGFSMGVPWALWSAAQRPAVAASVAYYGTLQGASLAHATVPVLAHFAEDDPYEPEASVRAFEQALRDAGRNAIIHRYPGTGHWFAEPSRDAYRAEAADLAFARTVAFLRQHLPAGR